ncbi:MAG: hypothetical protein ACLFSB_01410 [Chitinispirillaceae bacterium]
MGNRKQEAATNVVENHAAGKEKPKTGAADYCRQLAVSCPEKEMPCIIHDKNIGLLRHSSAGLFYILKVNHRLAFFSETTCSEKKAE